MQLSSQVLHFLTLIGTVNGGVLSLYLLFAKQVTQERKWLSVLVLTVSFRLIWQAWPYFNPSMTKPLVSLELLTSLMLGPLLYFYLASATNQLNSMKISWQLHLFGLLSALVMVSFLLFSQSTYGEWEATIYRAVNWIGVIYIALSTLVLLPLAIVWVGDNSRLNQKDWLDVKVFFGITIVWLVSSTPSTTSYAEGALLLVFIHYLSLQIWRLDCAKSDNKI